MRTHISQQQRDRAWLLALSYSLLVYEALSYSLLVYAALSYYLADGVAERVSDGKMSEHAAPVSICTCVLGKQGH